MKKITLIKDVFKTIGLPEITYVERDNGKHERELKRSIERSGTLSLLTGPSKTGKTSLFVKVVGDLGKLPLVVRCDNQLTSDDIWKKALEKVNFDRVSQKSGSQETEISTNVKAGTKIGWSWLAGVLGEISFGLKGKFSDAEIREKILAKPSPDHLIPILKQLPYILIIEDFHYLKADVKVSVFQQWKTFVDNEVSVIVIGTSHHAVDIAFSNKDLVGRINHIELNTWETKDLKKIVKQGFKYLNIEIKSDIIDILAKESVGLPIITQAACLQLFDERQITQLNIKNENKIDFTSEDTYNALHIVATTSYRSFKSIYEILSSGLRRKRRYNTYELLLLLFQKDPITFKLRRHEIDDRINNLEINIEKPPAASINSTLSSLEKLQSSKNIELLEWSKSERCLYILEPSFLFYLRWKEKRSSQSSFSELMKLFETRFFNIQTSFSGTFKKNQFVDPFKSDFE